MQIITEEELIKEWKLDTPKQLNVFKRMLNKNLPKRVCPRYINPKHIIDLGDVKKFYFDPEKQIPEIKFKLA